MFCHAIVTGGKLSRSLAARAILRVARVPSIFGFMTYSFEVTRVPGLLDRSYRGQSRDLYT